MAEHPGSRETYDFIADWVAPDFFYSKKDVWHRFGFLGVFGDYILSCTPGDILEIGVGESSIYLSALSRKYNRRIYHCDIAASKIINPLTIPNYLSQDSTFFAERDPTPDVLQRSVCFAGHSDELKQRLQIPPLAILFIDGDHLYEQARKDFMNYWPFVVDHGYALLHDTYPPNAEYLDENHCGEVWKLRKELEQNDRMDVLTLTKGTAMGVGLTICRKRPLMGPEYQ